LKQGLFTTKPGFLSRDARQSEPSPLSFSFPDRMLFALSFATIKIRFFGLASVTGHTSLRVSSLASDSTPAFRQQGSLGLQSTQAAPNFGSAPGPPFGLALSGAFPPWV